MITLQTKWDNFQANGLTGNIWLSKENVKDLDKIHKSRYNKSIDKSCGKCIKSAFIKVFSDQPKDPVKEVKKAVQVKKIQTPEEVKENVKKAFMTFPKHTPKTTLLSDIYGDINDPASIQFHAHMVEEIHEQTRRLRIPINTAYVMDSKIYAKALRKKGIKITRKGEVDLLVCLQGTSDETQKTIKKLNPRYIHSNMVIPGYQQLGTALREGALYRR